MKQETKICWDSRDERWSPDDVRTYECGCKIKYTHYNHMKRKGPGYVSFVDYYNECDKHRILREEEEKKKRAEFGVESFPSKEARQIYNLLDEMIDRLRWYGVDLSFFPKEAYQLMKKIAVKISKLKYEPLIPPDKKVP